MKLILSLDGGGIRERFVVELLSFIELAMGKKLHEVFDMVVGVSAGAVTASVLAIGEYKSIESTLINQFEVFREKRAHDNGLLGTMYSGSGKRSEMNRLFRNKKMNDVKIPLAILTAKMSDGEAVVFTSSDKTASSDYIKDVVDASSAAPVYFPAVKIAGTYYIDGGVVNNDPVFIGVEFARKLWGEHESVAILSMGTGISAKVNVNGTHPTDFGLIKWLQEGLMTIMTDSRRNYNEPIINYLVGEGNYLRINSHITGSTDDMKISKEVELRQSAGDVWVREGDKILAWIHKIKGIAPRSIF